MFDVLKPVVINKSHPLWSSTSACTTEVLEVSTAGGLGGGGGGGADRWDVSLPALWPETWKKV